MCITLIQTLEVALRAMEEEMKMKRTTTGTPLEGIHVVVQDQSVA